MNVHRRLPAVAAIVAAAVLVIMVAAVLHAGRAPFAWDRAIMAAMRRAGAPAQPAGPGWLKPAMTDVTALGDGTVLTLVVLVAAGLFLVLRRWRLALLVVAASWSGAALAAEAKLWIGRARPDLAGRLVDVGGLSFPSGHATNSAIVYLTLATLATHAERGAAVRRYTVAVAALLVTIIGMSRVYLGVHWPSDVLAGWSAGTLWALLWWWIGLRLRLR